MAKSYSQISRGSSGEEVKTLQQMLNSSGNYNLETDGVFGSKTLAAVQDYQQKNGLTVDGIVGEQTWGALTNASKTSTQTAAQTPKQTQNNTQASPDYSQYSYDASTNTAYQQALAALQQATANVPTYQASYDDQLQEVYDRIVNREKFSYDLNSDALYQQYADQYQMMGQQAMMDTMGQAAAMTGGYGNSYASTAGNQAYQGYLQQLNEVVPELYSMALDQYNAEGDKLLTQYSMLNDMADDEYGKYRDSVSDYWQQVGYLTDSANTAYDRGYNDFINSYQMGTDAENTEYSRQQAAYERLVSLITSTGYTPTAAELQAAGMSEEQAAAYADYFEKQNPTGGSGGSGGSGSSGGSSGSGGSGGGGNYSSETAKVQKQLNELGANLTVDGVWGPKTQAAYEKYMGGSGGDGQTGSTSGVSDSIKNKAAGFTNNTDLANYLDGLTASGSITEEQADALYAENKQVDKAALSERTWTLVNDGGLNWFGGVDNNATVKDQYGNTYRLDKLVNALVAEGMTKSDAKAYVKKLQAQLGA